METMSEHNRQDFAPPSIPEQVERLVALGVPAVLGIDESQLRDEGRRFDETTNALLVPASRNLDYGALMALAVRGDKPGFVVEDMTDVGDFAPIPEGEVPDRQWYILEDIHRGDEFKSATPEEALAAITSNGRTPLTINEGIFWLLQNPEVLEQGSCYMTIGSRKIKANGGYDSRTPALWISGGTGRDGAARKDAAKLGWCWWKNHHTWLGIAHAAGRRTT